jgi:hypothetical protein
MDPWGDGESSAAPRSVGSPQDKGDAFDPWGDHASGRKDHGDNHGQNSPETGPATNLWGEPAAPLASGRERSALLGSTAAA